MRGTELRYSAAAVALLAASLVLVALGASLGLGAYSSYAQAGTRTLYSFDRISMFSAVYSLRPNDVYGTSWRAEPGKTMYLSLVRDVRVSYTYQVLNARESGYVRIAVTIRHPDGWSKLVEVRSVRINGSQTTAVLNLSIPRIVEEFKRLCSEVGARSTDFSIGITSAVYARARAGNSTISEKPLVHTIYLSIDIPNNRVVLVGNETVSDHVSKVVRVKRSASFLGAEMSPGQAMAYSVAALGSGAVGLGIALPMVARRRESSTERIERRYRDLIISVDEIPSDRPWIRVSNPEDLVKLAKLLESPLLLERGDGVRRIAVASRSYVYVYELEPREDGSDVDR